MIRAPALLIVALLTLLAGTALADEPEPSVCPVAPSTITFDLGFYRGAYLVTQADGAKLGHTGWQSCPPQPPHREHAWEGCNFSLCDLPDGSYQLRFADPPAAPTFAFTAHHAQITLAPTDLGAQAGFYGVDASGGHRPVQLNLAGYALDWSIAHWPGPFHGTETHGHAVADAAAVNVSLYPGVAYTFHFAGAAATLSVDRAGAVTIAPQGGPLAASGKVARLRVGTYRITPPTQGDWWANGTPFTGPQTLALPAGAHVDLTQGATAQTLTLDAACHTTPGGPFNVAPAGGTAATCS